MEKKINELRKIINEYLPDFAGTFDCFADKNGRYNVVIYFTNPRFTEGRITYSFLNLLSGCLNTRDIEVCLASKTICNYGATFYV